MLWELALVISNKYKIKDLLYVNVIIVKEICSKKLSKVFWR